MSKKGIENKKRLQNPKFGYKTLIGHREIAGSGREKEIEESETRKPRIGDGRSPSSDR